MFVNKPHTSKANSWKKCVDDVSNNPKNKIYLFELHRKKKKQKQQTTNIVIYTGTKNRHLRVWTDFHIDKSGYLNKQ